MEKDTEHFTDDCTVSAGFRDMTSMSVSTRSSNEDSDIPESSVFSHDDRGGKLAEAKIRDLVERIIQESTKQSQACQKLLLFSMELPNEAANLQHERRFLSESANAFAAATQPAKSPEASRQTLQHFHADLERCLNGLAKQGRLYDACRDLMLQTLSTDDGFWNVLGELATYLDIALPKDMPEDPPPPRQVTPSESSDEPDTHLQLKAYYAAAQQYGIAREQLMDIEVELEEQRTERQFLTELGALPSGGDLDAERSCMERRTKALHRLRKTEMEQIKAREHCELAGVEVPDASAPAKTLATQSVVDMATPDQHTATIPAPWPSPAVSADVNSWLRAVEPRPSSRYRRSGTRRHEIDQDFARRRPQFFEIGRVFKAAIPELAAPSRSSASQSSSSELSTDSWGQNLFIKPRAFIVVQEGATFCKAVPITSYGMKGVAKKGVVKQYHAIVHTSETAPLPQANEAPNLARGEMPMQSHPIHIRARSGWLLDKMMRVNLADPIKVEHYVVVRDVGSVHQSSIDALRQQYQAVSNLQLSPIGSSAIHIPAALRNPAGLSNKTKAVREILRRLDWTEESIREAEMELGAMSVGAASDVKDAV